MDALVMPVAALVVNASNGGELSLIDEKRYGIHISRCFLMFGNKPTCSVSED